MLTNHEGPLNANFHFYQRSQDSWEAQNKTHFILQAFFKYSTETSGLKKKADSNKKQNAETPPKKLDLLLTKCVKKVCILSPSYFLLCGFVTLLISCHYKPSDRLRETGQKTKKARTTEIFSPKIEPLYLLCGFVTLVFW